MRDERLFLFDLDHTLLPFDSGLAWAQLLVEQGFLAESVAEAYLDHCKRYVAGELPIDALHAFATCSLLPSETERLNTCQARFETYLNTRISDAARKLVAASREAGMCAIVTATNLCIAQPAAAAFEIEHTIATCVRFGDAGDPSISGLPCHGAEKIARVSAWLEAQGRDWSSFAEIHFFSDSASDLPLLQRVTHPTAVHPDRNLRAHAERMGWRILDDLHI